MDLRKCMENLRYDMANGGLEEDSFAMNCYITMAIRACRILKNGASQEEMDDAREYLALCISSGIDSLKCVVGERY